MERLGLRAGLRVLRRGPDQLQIGLDPRHAVVLPDTDPVRRTLRVAARHGPTSAADADVVERLRSHDALARPDPDPTGVDLRTFGPPLLSDVGALLTRAGLSLVDPVRESADVGLLIGAGEPARDLLDPWVAEGLPHLVVRLSEGTAVLGPFVDPGRTACLRCVDAHHTDADRRWPILVEQQVTTPRRADDLPDPTPAGLVALATGWAVCELAGYQTRARPATWSATLRLPEMLTGLELVTWHRHPECGCAWNPALTAGA